MDQEHTSKERETDLGLPAVVGSLTFLLTFLLRLGVLTSSMIGLQRSINTDTRKKQIETANSLWFGLCQNVAKVGVEEFKAM